MSEAKAGEDGERASSPAQEQEKAALGLGPAPLRKPETIICFCLISQRVLHKYLCLTLINNKTHY